MLYIFIFKHKNQTSEEFLLTDQKFKEKKLNDKKKVLKQQQKTETI